APRPSAPSLHDARPISGGGRDEAHVGGDRLDDDAGHGVVEVGHDVVGDDAGVLHGGGGDAGGAGQPEGGEAAAGLGEEQVAVAVVVAGELHDDVAAGEAAGDADRGHRGLGAGGHEPHELDRRDPLGDGLGEEHIPLGGGAVGGAVHRRPLHGLDDGGVGVVGDDRPVGLREVDVAAALDVPHVGALGPGGEVGRAAHAAEGPDGAVDAAGDDGLGA